MEYLQPCYINHYEVSSFKRHVKFNTMKSLHSVNQVKINTIQLRDYNTSSVILLIPWGTRGVLPMIKVYS